MTTVVTDLLITYTNNQGLTDPKSDRTAVGSFISPKSRAYIVRNLPSSTWGYVLTFSG
jgi:hypothetical protein